MDLSRSITLQTKGEAPKREEVDLTKEMTRSQYEAIVQQALDTHEQDAEDYLKKVEARMQRSPPPPSPTMPPLSNPASANCTRYDLTGAWGACDGAWTGRRPGSCALLCCGFPGGQKSSKSASCPLH